MSLEHITLEDAKQLLQLPRELGVDPADGEVISAANGRYGPYVVKGKDFRSIDSEEQLLTITLSEAIKIYELPKVFRRGGARNMAAAGRCASSVTTRRRVAKWSPKMVALVSM